MAINFTDFSSKDKWHADKFGGVSELLPNILKGYKMGKEPEKMQADLDYKKSQTAKALQGGSLQGMARDRMDLERLRVKVGEGSEVYKGAKRDFQNREDVQRSNIDRREQLSQYETWASMSQDRKANVQGKYAALGIHDENQQIKLFVNGMSPEKITAERKRQAEEDAGQQSANNNASPNASANDLPEVPGRPNVDPTGRIKPSTISTNADISSINQSKAARNEDMFMEPHLREVAKYHANKIGETSINLIKDSMSKDPQIMQQVAKALAVRAITPEISGYRARATDSSNAHKALQEITSKSLLGLNAFNFQIDAETFKIAQGMISELIQGMGKSREDGLAGIDHEEIKMANQMSSTINNAQQPQQQQPQQQQKVINVEAILKKLEANRGRR